MLQLRPAEAERALFRLGFAEIRRRGAHRHYRHPISGRQTQIPFHPGPPSRRVVRGILKDIGLTESQIQEHL
ncbi:MAG TPA: type II toxin-antitoxin system HicA family toxin [Dehalococcoidia bacterium]|nr:type II toxin-antitoxin system HicA family toxin [Dehalococcoidia bacterium]